MTIGSLPPLERPANLFPLFERPLDLCLQSKITELILSFQVPCGSINILFASRIFLFMELTFVRFFFPVICWSYLWTKISVTLSIGNKLYFPPCSFIFVTLLMLSWDRIESPKFIVASSACCLASVPDDQCSMADWKPKGPRLRLGYLRVGELYYWHFWHLCIALDLAVHFKL